MIDEREQSFDLTAPQETYDENEEVPEKSDLKTPMTVRESTFDVEEREQI